MKTNPPLKLAVIGDPVDHSASPALHRAFMAEAGIVGTYEAIRVVAGDVARAVARLRAAGYTGLNVTTPLKEEAFALAQAHDTAALAASSVNTLLLNDKIIGHNTDGEGAIGACRAAGLITISDATILILGVGPTARSCAAALIAAGAKTLIWNRTPENAQTLATRLAVHVWTPAAPVPDAVISALPPNATPEDEALLHVLQKTPILIDANYGPRATLSQALNRPTQTGEAMLEASARASFTLFHPPIPR